MALTADLRILLRLARGMSRQGGHTARLEGFYAPQADAYDAFRERLLRGRRELIAELALAPGARVVELGAGTGRNLDYFGDALVRLGSVDLVDLCPSLLAQARRRAAGHPHVRVIEADAAAYQPETPVDCVIFSYSLTMMPNWRAALTNALAMLRPGGMLAVVDFTLLATQTRLARGFWKLWFGHDGVQLDGAHGDTLRRLCPDHRWQEERAPVPYLPGLRAPYYLFIGRKCSA